MHAIALGQKLEEFEPYWLEEPCQVEHIEAIAEVRAAVNIPVVTGENSFTEEGLIQRITNTIAPDSWSRAGGAGTIQ